MLLFLEKEWLSVLLWTGIFSGFELNEKSKLTVCYKNEEMAAAVINLSVGRKVEFAADLQMVDLGLRPAYSMPNGVTLKSKELKSCNCIGERIQVLYYNQKITSQIISIWLFLTAHGKALFSGETTGWKRTVCMTLEECLEQFSRHIASFCIGFFVSRAKADGGNSPIIEGCNGAITAITCSDLQDREQKVAKT